MAGVTVFEIPVVGSRPQTFSISLNGVLYIWRLLWNDPAQCWIVNISDRNGNPLINGIALTPGSNLIDQFNYITGAATLFVLSDYEPGATPGFDDLGITGHVYYLPPPR